MRTEDDGGSDGDADIVYGNGRVPSAATTG